ncbi:MAG: MFS transporter [Spirochaetaceae bacterium]|nr:MAG: MFS transporter [Spirochaetaceae bacterium]
MTCRKLSPVLNFQLCESSPSDLHKLDVSLANRMLFQIDLINAFERRVIELKDADCVNGPIHVSIGHEAIAAATMAALRSSDRIAGSHRAHHHFLAKALNHVTPERWNPANEAAPDAAYEVVRRTLAEIMGLAEGYCGGRGGSMHLRWADAGVLGTNAIVSGGVPLSTGAAWAERLRETGNVVVVFLGDGGVNQGSFHEAANMAAVWKIPIIYFIENNQYAVATNAADVSAVENLSQHALGLDIEARVVYGHDVAGIVFTVEKLVRGMRGGGGPAMIEAKCYRHYHHGGGLKGSQYGYRPTREEAEWLARDAYTTYPAALIGQKMLSEEDADRIKSMAEEIVDAAVEHCTVKEGGALLVKPELWPDPASVALGMRSDGAELEGLPYRSGPLAGADETEEMTYSDAIAAVTGRWMERDEGTMVIGEEVANFGGGAYGATKGLPKLYPSRVVNTPISEGGFSGVGLGLAMSGMRPVIEIMFPDFTLVAADQIFNQIAKARHMYGGTTDIPLVLRTRVATGCGYGGQHSMDPIGLYALFSGWRIVAPSSSAEYIGLFNTAMHSLDPVLVLEHHSLYGISTPVPKGDLDYCIPFGEAALAREGSDITVICYGAMVRRVMSLVPAIEEAGVSAEIIDLRTLDLASLDYATVGESLTKTGVVVIVEEAAAGQSIGRRIASEVTERFFDNLDAPPGCIASRDVPNSVSRVLEQAAIISDDEIRDLVVQMGRRSWK